MKTKLQHFIVYYNPCYVLWSSVSVSRPCSCLQSRTNSNLKMFCCTKVVGVLLWRSKNDVTLCNTEGSRCEVLMFLLTLFLFILFSEIVRWKHKHVLTTTTTTQHITFYMYVFMQHSMFNTTVKWFYWEIRQWQFWLRDKTEILHINKEIRNSNVLWTVVHYTIIPLLARGTYCTVL